MGVEVDRYEVVVDLGGLSGISAQWGWLALTVLLGGVCVWCLVRIRDVGRSVGGRLGVAVVFLVTAWLAYTTLSVVTEAKWQRQRDRQVAAITAESGYRLVPDRTPAGNGALLDSTVSVEHDGARKTCLLTSYLLHPRTGEWTTGPLGRGNSSDTAKVVLSCAPETLGPVPPITALTSSRPAPPPGATIIPGPTLPPGVTLPGVTLPPDITIPPGFDRPAG
ncbi:hypothetical protein [Nocardia lasii]|uniref:DUF4190 domain-containing protein n=1 Tax=Nocardia lasii TaxID=1616107 RepID=A0ABW1JUA7_9NOCA